MNIIAKPKFTAQTSLNRLSEKRGDVAYIERALAASNARALLLADLKIPIVSSDDRASAKLRWLTPSGINALTFQPEFIFLGEDGAGTPVFCCNLAGHEVIRCEYELVRLQPLVDLRSLALQGVLSDDELLIAAQARAILGWHAAMRCCHRCGGQLKSIDGGWRKQCAACTLDHYPRTDPAVIMLITHEGRCLLGHELRFPDKLYSTLAGFVEAGDDIEHAVRREVKEETGVDVGAVHYVASQPWPFPHQLMIGCCGEALTDHITIDPKEIVDARWFDRDEVASMMAFRHPDGLFAPPSISMAHVLLRGFLDGALAS